MSSKKIYLFYTCDSNKMIESMRVSCVTTSLRRLKKSLIANINCGLIPDLSENNKNICIREIRNIFSSTIPSMIADEINKYFSGYIYIQVWYD
ncbi:MAG: hypothetical protein L6V86_08750 [Treponema sp.]|nr:MAG: hypothetical protein L6V86_08750 [Treponema sp.]